MAYREAKTDKEKKRGKSTDELSLKEATAFFKKRGKEKGATKFRWRGDVYNLSGEKIGGEKTSTKKSSSAPKESKRPMRRTGKLNDDAKAARTTSSEKYGTGSGPRTAAPKKRTSSGLSISGKVYPKTSKVPNPEDSVKAGSLTVTPSQRLSDAGKRLDSYKVSKENKSINGVTFDEWRKLSRSERVEKNLPLTNQEFMRAMRLKGKTSGMSKGGMVKSGNKDYKKSGMFYKSGSPRGYK